MKHVNVTQTLETRTLDPNNWLRADSIILENLFMPMFLCNETEMVDAVEILCIIT